MEAEVTPLEDIMEEEEESILPGASIGQIDPEAAQQAGGGVEPAVGTEDER